jgi:PhoH-like ATPase
MLKKAPKLVHSEAREALDGEKIFVLDTSVILYDNDAINHFDEHHVAIPIQVLEELDNFKKGNETRNFEAREFIRFIDSISKDNMINEWVSLGRKRGKFKVVFDQKAGAIDAESVYGSGKYDHKILNAALALKGQYPEKKVILVSKDIALRLKAKALNLAAEDYETGKIKDVRKLYTGKTTVHPTEKVFNDFVKNGWTTLTKLKASESSDNHFFILRLKRKTAIGIYKAKQRKVIAINKGKAFKITSRNAEQACAMYALMDPDIKLVSLQGMAGTGKTLLAMACSLEQRRSYRQIFVTCPVIPLSNKDIGYLPGDIKSKLDPYMQPIHDNLKFIKSQYSRDDREFAAIDEFVANEKIAISPLAYIRGRSLSKAFFIVDEAQNLTPHEIKTIISRAGDGTKMVFLGDIYQIDTPYLDAQSNGLSYLIDRVGSNQLFAHITLEKGERSQLANLANELL